MVSLQPPVCDFGTKAVHFSLPGVDQQQWTLEKCSGDRGLLVMFISNHCPYVKAIRKKLVRDTRALMTLGINSVAIMPNDTVAYPDDSAANMLRISNEFDFPFPYVLDDTQGRELFEAMKQVAETGHGPEHQIPSMGCSIKWRENG
jgi:hypothetical protein